MGMIRAPIQDGGLRELNEEHKWNTWQRMCSKYCVQSTLQFLVFSMPLNTDVTVGHDRPLSCCLAMFSQCLHRGSDKTNSGEAFWGGGIRGLFGPSHSYHLWNTGSIISQFQDSGDWGAAGAWTQKLESVCSLLFWPVGLREPLVNGTKEIILIYLTDVRGIVQSYICFFSPHCLSNGDYYRSK